MSAGGSHSKRPPRSDKSRSSSGKLTFCTSDSMPGDPPRMRKWNQLDQVEKAETENDVKQLAVLQYLKQLWIKILPLVDLVLLTNCGFGGSQIPLLYGSHFRMVRRWEFSNPPAIPWPFRGAKTRWRPRRSAETHQASSAPPGSTLCRPRHAWAAAMFSPLGFSASNHSSTNSQKLINIGKLQDCM